MMIMQIINMKIFSYHKYLFLLLALTFLFMSKGLAQTADELPVREYTNPEEVVTFDRTTSFSRALDVINQFSQQYRGKMILDRTGVDGNIGISIPPMHWMDALKMMLNVKQLQLIEQSDYYEIVPPQQSQGNETTTGNTVNTQTPEGEGPVANTGTREVQINAIFFEGNKRALSEIGVDWSTISDNVPESALDSQGGGGGGGDGGQIPSAEFDGPFVQVNSTGAQNVSQSVFDALVNIGEIGNTGIDVQALFSAFEADNLGEILSSPSVKVMNGEEGRIQVGQDFSIKQRDFAGNVVEQFFSVGTILTVTPQIIEQQDTTFIHLDISAERSSAQPDPVSTVINKTQAETQSLLMDEEATVIAGMYRTEYAEVRRGVPILKDLPSWFFGLRYLFGYSSKDNLTRELVIILQASIAPSIPERFGEDYQNKYQVLEDERSRMQREAEQGTKLRKGIPVDEDIHNEISQDTTEIEPETDLEKEPHVQPEKIQEDSSATVEETDTASSVKKDSTVVTDPELDNREIKLNLGGEDHNDTTAVDEPQEQTKDQSLNNDITSSMNYYIIGGSFGSEENADRFSKKLQEEGFKPVVLDNPNSESKMVAYSGYEDRKTAKADLIAIQQNENPSAWLFRVE